MKNAYAELKSLLGLSPLWHDDLNPSLQKICHELIEWLAQNTHQQISSNQFWSIIRFTREHLSGNPQIKTGLLITIVRLLMDAIRQNSFSLLRCDSKTLVIQRTRELEQMRKIAECSGDGMLAQSIHRQIAQQFLISGDDSSTCDLLDQTITWLQHLSVLNLLQQAECIERLVLKDGLEPYENKLIQLVEALKHRSQNRRESMSNRCRMIHSAGLLELAADNWTSAGRQLNKAYNMALKSISSDVESSDDVNTAILTASSVMSFSLKMGNLSRAEEVYYQGKRLLTRNESKIQPLYRFVFRQNAAGFLYRVGDIQEAIRLYLKIDSEDSGGRLAGALGYCGVLSSKGLIQQGYGYQRRALRNHRQALNILEQTGNTGIQYGQTLVHLSTSLCRLGKHSDALAALNNAKSIFSRHHSVDNLIRTLLVEARTHNGQHQYDAAESCCEEAQDLLRKNGFEQDELHLRLQVVKIETLRGQGNHEQSDSLLMELEEMFNSHKRSFKFMHSRLSYSNEFRACFTDNLSQSRLSVVDRWNSALKILENDRADLFSDCLSYYVKIIDNKLAIPLYETFLELKAQYVKALQGSSRSASKKHIEKNREQIRDEMEDLLDRILSFETASSDYLFADSIDLERILEIINRNKNGDDICVSAYVLAEDCLNILVISTGQQSGTPRLNHYEIVAGSKFLSVEQLQENLSKLKTLIEEHRQAAHKLFSILDTIPPEIRPEDFDKFHQQYRDISRALKRRLRSPESLRDLIELSVYAMNLSFLLVKLNNLHPETRRRVKAIHKKDMFIFELLYDLLIRPINENLTDNTQLVAIVSEVMSRIPFEALKDKSVDAPFGYFIFPNRSVNYYRSPWLFTKVNQPFESPIDGDSDIQYLTLFSPLESATGSEPAAYNLERLMTPRLQKDRQVIVNWLKSHEATCEAFRQTGPGSHGIVVESHSTFDRLQPFLSRILFAGGEPLTAMDIFARYTFDVTSLMILVACESDQLYDADIKKVGVSVAEVLQAKGVEQIIAPMWTVEQRASRDLMRRFVEQSGEYSRAVDAFAAAQREHSLMRGAHPYFWAAFSFSGHIGGSNHIESIESA